MQTADRGANVSPQTIDALGSRLVGAAAVRPRDAAPTPSRITKPRRNAPALALAPPPAGPAPTSLDRQRARRLVTAAEAVHEFPFEGLPQAAGSRELLRDNLEGREACQLEAFEPALATERASLAFFAKDGSLDAVRAGLSALLEFFDEEPELANYLVVHSAQASEAVLERRSEVIERSAKLLDDERAPARGYPPPLTAQAVASGRLGVLSERLSRAGSAPLSELAGPLMSFTVLPFLGVRAARRELTHSRPGSGPAANDATILDPLRTHGDRLNSRAVSALEVIGAEAGLTSKGVSSRTGVNDDAQMSRLLARLERLGLIENARERHGRANRKDWKITAAGQGVKDAIDREANVPEPASAFHLPKQYVGRINDRAILMLRVIAGQPWLRNTEVADRGVEDKTLAASLLESLVDLGLAASEREARRRGTPNVWRLTPAGEQLDRAIGHETPPPARSIALDLMRHSGGRLSDTAGSVLRVIGAEPGVSNNDIAARVGIADENNMSQLLARLANRELVKNTREGGKFNVWHLTPAGEKIERAVWAETPPAEQYRLSLGLVRDHRKPGRRPAPVRSDRLAAHALGHGARDGESRRHPEGELMPSPGRVSRPKLALFSRPKQRVGEGGRVCLHANALRRSKQPDNDRSKPFYRQSYDRQGRPFRSVGIRNSGAMVRANGEP
jgi:DNA-binding MarR family transcriptional regulator